MLDNPAMSVGSGAAQGMMAGGPWGALAGGVMSGIGSLLTRGANKSAAAKQLAMQEQAYRMANQGYSAAIGKQNAATGAIKTAFTGARGNLGALSSKGWGNSLQTQNVQNATADANTGRRGMLTSSVAENARRGIYTDTTTHLQALDETIGQMAQQLGIQEAGAMAQSEGQGASLYAQRGETLAKYKSNAANFVPSYSFDSKAMGEGMASLFSYLYPNKPGAGPGTN
jgi:hypothetical protein